jgi:hypothetical protein
MVRRSWPGALEPSWESVLTLFVSNARVSKAAPLSDYVVDDLGLMYLGI